jgi:hypothetical protein
MQHVRKVEFMSTTGMRVAVVHEGDEYVVKKLDYVPSGMDVFVDVTLVRKVNNAKAYRTTL